MPANTLSFSRSFQPIFSSVLMNPDGSFTAIITMQSLTNPADNQFHTVLVSPDGSGFAVDGQAISNPSAALQAWGASLASLVTKANTMLNDNGVRNFLQSLS